MSDMVNSVIATIEKHNLIKKNESILSALSGGADSVCLLFVLQSLAERYGLKIYAAHLNHGLRGDDADSDEKFAAEICRNLSVPFFSKKTDVALFAKENNISEEEAGRICRYDFFDYLTKKHKIDKVATAHNLNDNIETVVMRFLRGTGVSGLGGIPYKNGNIIRPLLDITRSEIEKYLHEKGIGFVTDKTNLETLYFRNKIRLELLPEIKEKYNPNFDMTLNQNIGNYRNAADYLSYAAKEAEKNILKCEGKYFCADIDLLLSEHEYIAKSIIYSAISGMGGDKQVTSNAVEGVWETVKKRQGAVDFSKDIYIEIKYNKIYFVPKNYNKKFCYTLNKPKNVYIEEYDASIKFEIAESADKGILCVDYDKIDGRKIEIRSRKDGDFFTPFGMRGRKKLKDFMIDMKIPNFMRNSIPVFTADNEIFCVGNMRIDDKFKITCNTKHILKIEIKNGGKIL